MGWWFSLSRMIPNEGVQVHSGLLSHHAMLRRTLLALALVMMCRSSWAQVPAGGEFRVNTYSYSIQDIPDISADRVGNFVVVWETREDGHGLGVSGRRFRRDGGAIGAEFRLHTFTTDSQFVPRVDVAPRGSWVATWSSRRLDRSESGIFARRFQSDGRPRGSELQVNTYTSFDQVFSDVAVAPDGRFVVVWESNTQDGSSWGVFGQRFTREGARAGGEFQINTFTPGAQSYARVELFESGAFVVVWSSAHDGSSVGAFGQRFDPSGARLGSEFAVNVYTTSAQFAGDIAVDQLGNFIVIWTSSGQDGDRSGVYGRRYDGDGVPTTGEFRVNTYTTGPQGAPSVAPDAEGNFAVVWQDDRLSNGHDIFIQRLQRNGSLRGSEFRVNTTTVIGQTSPVVASDEIGNLTVAWGGFVAGDVEVSGQRFGGLTAEALRVDGGGNGVLEAGEAVSVEPAWLNVNGVSQTFSGAFSDLAGPPPAVYALTDASGEYGSVASGSVGSCVDCYGVSVSTAVPRPALHWDASVLESVAPDAQGQGKRWRLHIGDSFDDVPRTSAFYTFVETVLHHGVSVGCTVGSYCPRQATSRAEMAALVLLAAEGGSYTPPACTTAVFADVAPGSPFCAWIAESARRGVVTGCGGGNYCPGASVTRAEMAVFVLRTLEPTLEPPACTTPVFSDVAPSSVFCRWIAELARRGVAAGCGAGKYCPAEPLTREQMAVFISAGFGLDLYSP